MFGWGCNSPRQQDNDVMLQILRVRISSSLSMLDEYVRKYVQLCRSNMIRDQRWNYFGTSGEEWKVEEMFQAGIEDGKNCDVENVREWYGKVWVS